MVRRVVLSILFLLFSTVVFPVKHTGNRPACQAARNGIVEFVQSKYDQARQNLNLVHIGVKNLEVFFEVAVDDVLKTRIRMTEQMLGKFAYLQNLHDVSNVELQKLRFAAFLANQWLEKIAQDLKMEMYRAVRNMGIAIGPFRQEIAVQGAS